MTRSEALTGFGSIASTVIETMLIARETRLQKFRNNLSKKQRGTTKIHHYHFLPATPRTKLKPIEASEVLGRIRKFQDKITVIRSNSLIHFNSPKAKCLSLRIFKTNSSRFPGRAQLFQTSTIDSVCRQKSTDVNLLFSSQSIFNIVSTTQTQLN